MKIQYDNEADAVYIYFADNGSKSVETKEIADEVFVDYDKQGQPIGIEIIGAKDKVPPKAIRFFKSHSKTESLPK